MSSSFSLQTFQPPRHTSPQMEKCHHFQKNTTHTNSYILCLCRKENVAEKKKRKCFVITGGGGVPPKPQIHCQQTFCVQTSSSFLGHLQWLVGWGGFSCMEGFFSAVFPHYLILHDSKPLSLLILAIWLGFLIDLGWRRGRGRND